MVAEGGVEVAFHGDFQEIVPDERLVSTEVYEGMPGDDGALTTTTFTEAGGRTTLAILMELPSREVRDMILETGMEVGMQEQMEILDELLASQS
jgi:uncharacterized protein YndB with AHSA1/START domain